MLLITNRNAAQGRFIQIIRKCGKETLLCVASFVSERYLDEKIKNNEIHKNDGRVHVFIFYARTVYRS